MTVTSMNAYKLNDNYAICKESTGEVIGLEHNETEAKAIASYMTNYHAQRHIVVKNSKNDVAEAKKIRKDVLRVKNRQEILEDVGAW